MAVREGTRNDEKHLALAVAILLMAASGGCLGQGDGPSGAASKSPAIGAPAQQSPFPTVEQALIWSYPYPNLTIEIDYVEGRAPVEIALDALVDTLDNVTDKEKIAIKDAKPIEGMTGNPNRVWRLDDLEAIHEQTLDDPRGHAYQTGTVILHVLYLDGVYQDGNVSARGLHNQGVLYLFKDRFSASGALLGAPVKEAAADRVERHVLIHELGHALGLVNCGIPMLTSREDPDSRCHSLNETSVMSTHVDRVDPVLDLAQDGKWAPYQFDDADLKDLQAFRETGRALRRSVTG